jgi:hypothetical protein
MENVPVAPAVGVMVMIPVVDALAIPSAVGGGVTMASDAVFTLDSDDDTRVAASNWLAVVDPGV